MNIKKEIEIFDENTKKGLQTDLLKMIDLEFDSFEDTDATNNLNQSQGKLNLTSNDGNNYNFISLEKEFNFENLGKELNTKNNVN
jgi:hypothetical protein